MSAANPEAIQEEVKKYLVIFAVILSLTLLTVGISYLKLSLPLSVFFVLLIAGLQVFLAAGYFMHLISEKFFLVYFVVVMGVGNAVPLLALPIIENHDTITGTIHHNHQSIPSKQDQQNHQEQNVH